MNTREPKEGDLKHRLLELAYRVLVGHPLRRFFTLVFASGVTLIAGEGVWFLIAEYVVSEYGVTAANEASENASEDWLTVRNAGLSLCGTGIALHVLYYAVEKFLEWRANKAQLQSKGWQLVGCLRELSTAFEEKSVERSPGFMSDEIRALRDLARTAKDLLPQEILADRVFASIKEAKIDASGNDPYFGVTAAEVSHFANRLETVLKDKPGQ